MNEFNEKLMLDELNQRIKSFLCNSAGIANRDTVEKIKIDIIVSEPDKRGRREIMIDSSDLRSTGMMGIFDLAFDSCKLSNFCSYAYEGDDGKVFASLDVVIDYHHFDGGSNLVLLATFQFFNGAWSISKNIFKH
jgi:hypothetical protein